MISAAWRCHQTTRPTLAYTRHQTEHYLARLTQEIRRLEPEAKAAEAYRPR
jgi:hypothetical protein